MSNVNTRQIDFCDWEAIEDFDFTCPVCDGAGEGFMVECPECDGTGYVDCGVCGGLGHLTDGEPCSECGGDGGWTCQICDGDGEVESDEECETCNGEGMVVPIWNTAWEIDMHDVSKETRLDIVESTNCVVFQDADGDYLLGLTGCGMDLSPDLCKAWLKLGFGWIPDNWIYKISRDRKYCEYVAGEEWTEKIYEVAVETLEHDISRAQRMINNIKGEN